jgi:hypothetical protein
MKNDYYKRGTRMVRCETFTKWFVEFLVPGFKIIVTLLCNIQMMFELSHYFYSHFEVK